MMKLKTFVGMVRIIGENSKCARKKVGAILVKGDRVISTGYNGLPSGSDDTICKEGCQGCDLTVHAEMNAILFAAKEGLSTQDTSLYVTWSPCLNCAKHIINAGITAVYFLNMYDKEAEAIRALNLLAKHCNVYEIKPINVNDKIRDYMTIPWGIEEPSSIFEPTPKCDCRSKSKEDSDIKIEVTNKGIESNKGRFTIISNDESLVNQFIVLARKRG